MKKFLFSVLGIFCLVIAGNFVFAIGFQDSLDAFILAMMPSCC